jgi:hypothetical protein
MRVVLAIAAAVVLALAPQASARRSSQIVSVDDLGSGASETWVFMPAEPPSCAVVFLHDGRDLDPAHYTAWLDYLVLGRSCAVIFPRYQQSAAATPAEAVRGLRAGISAGFSHLRRAQFGLEGKRAARMLPTVVAGVGHGGTLAFYYAANARRWGLPVPAAIDSVFPARGRFPGVPLPKLPGGTSVLIQIGDRDPLAGRTAAVDLRQYLASVPAPSKRVRIVHSKAGLKATRGAPLQTSAVAENTFWPPLDELIDAAS